ncbi:sugar phosphate isomerase/epimerase family protein [Aestuariivivens sediminis]|uniref:sugar phosphate isomerase/epimerase family protein n=1 Tax=Aestuariivivens sediminis TaxID=2913557 RepID=UPI001F57D56B|nr:sugar phosphate isomerase/epimerase [Aestuariivivens sediminis]
MKQSIITAFLGKTQDRFSDYQETTNLEERLEFVNKIEGVKGIEIVYPYETGEPAETKLLLEKYKLEFAAVNANIKKEPIFVPGAISRPQKEIRQKAVDIIKRAKDYAKEVGAPLVTCCPLSDGFDNLFQVDYPKSWRNMIDSVAEASEYLPEIPLFIEYKFNETRVNCNLDTCAKSIVLLKEVNNPATGITIDFGHSLLAKENPAQAIALCEESGIDYYLHTNDNDWNFDWDLIGASRNFLHTVEFFFYAKEFGYNKFFTADASPRIFDMVDFFNEHISMNQAVWNLVEKLDRENYRQLMKEEKSMELMRLVRKEIYRI